MSTKEEDDNEVKQFIEELQEQKIADQEWVKKRIESFKNDPLIAFIRESLVKEQNFNDEK